MKESLKRVVAALAVAGICATANAAVDLTLDGAGVKLTDPPNTLLWGPPALMSTAWYTGNPTAADIQAFLSANYPSWPTVDSSLYKWDGQETGTFKDAYTTSTAGPPQTYIITWDGPAVADPTYLLIKDGNAGSYLWNISHWDGEGTLTIINTGLAAFAAKGEPFSHVELFSGTPVPEPSTVIAGALLLLPFGVSTLRMLRRKTS